MAKKKSAKKPIRIKGGTRPPDRVLTPTGEVPAASLPLHPITFGRPVSNVDPQPAAPRAVGSRAAMAFIESLGNNSAG